MEKNQQTRQRRGMYFQSMLPILELIGQNRLLIENHQGVLSYSVKKIEIKVLYGSMIVTGEDLCLIEMSKVKLVICGRVDGLQLFGG